MATMAATETTAAMALDVALPRAVLCGSFRRDPAALHVDRDRLIASGCLVLSPISLDFVDEVDGFVRTAAELGKSPADIEARHIDAIRSADFVWLHVPGGYVGPSAALEVGIAHSLDIPIYASAPPDDRTIAEFVTVLNGPEAAVAICSRAPRTPAGPLRDLQDYYGRMAALRGFADESPQDTMLLLTEEVGELARAIRKRVALARAESIDQDPAGELADVQLYVLHLANIVGIDLADAVAAKERVNHIRYGRRDAA